MKKNTKTNKKIERASKKIHELDPEYIQNKILLIEKGLPVDISEEELSTLETILRGARSFYIDMIGSLHKRRDMGENVEVHIVEESKNLSGVELALRKVDEFRAKHWAHIKTD